jgi:hypothetical protein
LLIWFEIFIDNPKSRLLFHPGSPDSGVWNALDPRIRTCNTGHRIYGVDPSVGIRSSDRLFTLMRRSLIRILVCLAYLRNRFS